MRIIHTFIIGLAVSLSSLFAAQVGKMAPDFSVQGHDGKTYTLKDLKGKYVVLEWFNPQCPYVKKQYNSKTKHMQTMQKNAKSIKNKPLVWLSVSSAHKGHPTYINAKQAKTVKEELNANMDAILIDKNGEMGQSFNATATPHMFIISPEGKILYQGGVDSANSIKVESIENAEHKYFHDALFNHVLKNKTIAKDKSSTKAIGCSVKYKPSA